MSAPQNYSNHTRLDPRFHFFLAPIFVANIVIVIWMAVRSWPEHQFLSIWEIVIAIALFAAVGAIRDYSLKVQDRVIRLEEKIRYERLLPPDLLERSHILTMKQVIALRFASDAELASMVKRTLAEGLNPKAIKQGIQTWKPDMQRV
jgi:hypothetical protein